MLVDHGLSWSIQHSLEREVPAKTPTKWDIVWEKVYGSHGHIISSPRTADVWPSEPVNRGLSQDLGPQKSYSWLYVFLWPLLKPNWWISRRNLYRISQSWVYPLTNRNLGCISDLLVMYFFSFSGWWFGTCLFYHMLGIVTPTDFHIFQMGRYTTNQIVYVCNSEKTDHFRLIKASKNSIFDAPPRRQDFCREKLWSRQLGSDSWGEDAAGKRWLGQLWMGKADVWCLVMINDV